MLLRLVRSYTLPFSLQYQFSNEGLANGQWVLLDYADVVVHVFNGHKRNEYDIEGLWKDAPRLHVDIPADLRMTDEIYDEPSF